MANDAGNAACKLAYIVASSINSKPRLLSDVGNSLSDRQADRNTGGSSRQEIGTSTQRVTAACANAVVPAILDNPYF